MPSDPFYLGYDFGIPRRERPLDDVTGDSPSLRVVTKNRRTKGKRVLPRNPTAGDRAKVAQGMVTSTVADAANLLLNPSARAGILQRGSEGAANAMRNLPGLSSLAALPGKAGSALRDAADYFTSDTANAIADLNVVGSGRDFLKSFDRAAQLRAQGREAEAANLERFAIPMLALGTVPLGGKAAKLAVRGGEDVLEAGGKAAARALEEEGASLAAKTEKPLAAKKTPKVAASARSVAPPNPTKVIAEEFSPETARRVRGQVGADAPLEEWRDVASRLHGTQSNTLYQPENDLAFRDFDLGTYGMRKTLDAPRLYDLDVGRERWKPEAETNEFRFQDLVGRPFMTGMSDRTPSGTVITRLGPTELDIPVFEYGGQDYMRDNPFSWGVSTKTMGSNFMNTARSLKRKYGVNPIWLPWRMQGPGSDFAKTTGEVIMSHANSNLGLDTRSAIDKFIKDNYIRDFAGIGDPQGYLQFGQLSGPNRKAMELDLSNKFAQEGALSLPLTRAIITDPNQLNRKAYHLQNVAEIDPDADVVVKAINPTYHYNTPGAYKGTLGPGLLEHLNVAELVAPTLRDKYSDLGDLSVFRGQNAPISPESWANQMAEYADKKAAFDAKIAAGGAGTPPREPVPIGNTSKFLQSVFATGFLDDKAAQELYDNLVSRGAHIR